MSKKQTKGIDARISKAYHASCNNIQIPMLGLIGVYAVGRKAIEAGADDDALASALRAHVETIRHS
jgi:hypothetical protein